ncbi:unnamed protein product, partial [Protopolystoma xenopodis]
MTSMVEREAMASSCLKLKVWSSPGVSHSFYLKACEVNDRNGLSRFFITEMSKIGNYSLLFFCTLIVLLGSSLSSMTSEELNGESDEDNLFEYPSDLQALAKRRAFFSQRLGKRGRDTSFDRS